MYTVLKRTSWAIVLLFRSFVLSRPCFSRRRGLLEVPNNHKTEVLQIIILLVQGKFYNL